MTCDSKINLFGYRPTFHIRNGMHIHMDSCDTLKNILPANQLFSLIDVKRKFINSDNHKFHQYQENDYLSS